MDFKIWNGTDRGLGNGAYRQTGQATEHLRLAFSGRAW